MLPPNCHLNCESTNRQPFSLLGLGTTRARRPTVNPPCNKYSAQQCGVAKYVRYQKKGDHWGGRELTLPAVGTADLREAPAKLCARSAEAIAVLCLSTKVNRNESALLRDRALWGICLSGRYLCLGPQRVAQP